MCQCHCVGLIETQLALTSEFGLYSMIDPHLMLLLIQLLGKEYLVWDKSADIEFVKASKRKVTSEIKISNKDLEVIRSNTDNGEKYFANFTVEIRDEDGDLVARVRKTIYVRRKQHEIEL